MGKWGRMGPERCRCENVRVALPARCRRKSLNMITSWQRDAANFPQKLRKNLCSLRLTWCSDSIIYFTFELQFYFELHSEDNIEKKRVKIFLMAFFRQNFRCRTTYLLVRLVRLSTRTEPYHKNWAVPPYQTGNISRIPQLRLQVYKFSLWLNKRWLQKSGKTMTKLETIWWMIAMLK